MSPFCPVLPEIFSDWGGKGIDKISGREACRIGSSTPIEVQKSTHCERFPKSSVLGRGFGEKFLDNMRAARAKSKHFSPGLFTSNPKASHLRVISRIISRAAGLSLNSWKKLGLGISVLIFVQVKLNLTRKSGKPPS